MERYCSSCGQKLEKDMMVCPQCGASQFKVTNTSFINKTVIGIIDIVAGGITALVGLEAFYGTSVDYGFLATGLGLIMTGVFFLTSK